MANMTQTPTVEPLAAPQAAPTVAPSAATPPPPETPAEAAQGLPDELLQIPAIQGLLAGAPAAVSMKIKGSEDRDEIALISENKDAVMAAGMGFYKSMSGEIGVMFNALKISPEDLRAADKAGKLETLAPDFDKVNLEISKSGEKHPILNASAPAAQFASPASTQTPPQAASGSLPLVPPAPASVAKKLASQRAANLTPGAPSSGASPGAGRILNSIMKPVV
jgi:hypothetical protein